MLHVSLLVLARAFSAVQLGFLVSLFSQRFRLNQITSHLRFLVFFDCARVVLCTILPLDLEFCSVDVLVLVLCRREALFLSSLTLCFRSGLVALGVTDWRPCARPGSAHHLVLCSNFLLGVSLCEPFLLVVCQHENADGPAGGVATVRTHHQHPVQHATVQRLSSGAEETDRGETKRFTGCSSVLKLCIHTYFAVVHAA